MPKCSTKRGFNLMWNLTHAHIKNFLSTLLVAWSPWVGYNCRIHKMIVLNSQKLRIKFHSSTFFHSQVFWPSPDFSAPLYVAIRSINNVTNTYRMEILSYWLNSFVCSSIQVFFNWNCCFPIKNLIRIIFFLFYMGV